MSLAYQAGPVQCPTLFAVPAVLPGEAITLVQFAQHTLGPLPGTHTDPSVTSLLTLPPESLLFPCATCELPPRFCTQPFSLQERCGFVRRVMSHSSGFLCLKWGQTQSRCSIGVC